MEMTLQLEVNQKVEHLYLLDGSHTFVSTHTGARRQAKTIDNDVMTEIEALMSFVEMFTTGKVLQVCSYVCLMGFVCLFSQW